MTSPRKIFPHATAFIFLIALIGICRPGRTEESAQGSEALDFGAWKIPIALLSKAVSESEKTPTQHPLPGFAPKENTPQWDASGFVRAMGVPAHPGEEILYDPSSSTLLIKTSKENLRFIGSVLSQIGLDHPAWYLVAELSVYTYEPTSGQDPTVWPSPNEFFAHGPDAPRLIDSLSGALKSGKKAHFVRRSATNGGKASPKEGGKELLGPTEPGMAAELESLVGPDEMMVDTALAFAWRGPLEKDLTADLRFDSTFTSFVNTPVIVQVSSLEKKPGTYLVVIANLRIETPVEWSLESLSQAAKRVREWQHPGTSSVKTGTR
jgi:hypothetical protein